MSSRRHIHRLPRPGPAAWSAVTVAILLAGWVGAGVSLAAPARIAVLELADSAGLTPAESNYLTDRVRSALAAALPGDDYLIMTRESISDLLPPGTSLSDCVDAACEVEIGRNLGADCVVTGEVLLFAGEFRLMLKAHDCHTAAFLTSETVGAAGLADLELRVEEVVGPVAARLRRSVRDTRRASVTPPVGTVGGTTVITDTVPWHLTEGPTTVVRFESRPSGAAVLVDGHLVCNETPCSRELATGLVTVTMERPGYGVREEMVHLTNGDGATVLAWDLTPDFGWLDVRTEPPGLTVSVEGRRLRPARGDSLVLQPGYHEILVVDPRYEPTSEVVEIRRGRRHSVVLKPVPRLGGLRISAVDANSNAVTATVLVDGRDIGTTPLEGEVLVGRHEITLEGEAGRWRGEVMVEEAKTTRLLAKLSRTGVAGAPNSVGMAMVRLEPGQFLMGSPPYERGRDRHEDRHQVRLTRPFLLGATEVTEAQWYEVMGITPGSYATNLPVRNVAWLDAVRYCNALSRREGLTPAYRIEGQQVRWLSDAEGYRLPTEAEWEYACRAGTTTRWSHGDEQADLIYVAWYAANSAGGPREAGTLEPNEWGLHDMHGNVWEWCWNWSSRYPSRFVTDPEGPDQGKSRVIRGGAWDTGATSCRSAKHNAAAPRLRGAMIGFRVARDASGP